MVTLLHSAQREHAFLGKIKQMSKSKKKAPRKKVSFELLHHRLGNISTKSLIDGCTANISNDIELRIYTDPFCISCQISSMKKRLDPKIHLTKGNFQMGFMDIIPETTPIVLTSETKFSNDILVVDAY